MPSTMALSINFFSLISHFNQDKIIGICVTNGHARIYPPFCSFWRSYSFSTAQVATFLGFSCRGRGRSISACSQKAEPLFPEAYPSNYWNWDISEVWQRIFDPGFTTHNQGKGREIAHTIVKAFVTQPKGIVIRKVPKSR